MSAILEGQLAFDPGDLRRYATVRNGPDYARPAPRPNPGRVDADVAEVQGRRKERSKSLGRPGWEVNDLQASQTATSRFHSENQIRTHPLVGDVCNAIVALYRE